MLAATFAAGRPMSSRRLPTSLAATTRCDSPGFQGGASGQTRLDEGFLSHGGNPIAGWFIKEHIFKVDD